jgi:hypothetical protein
MQEEQRRLVATLKEKELVISSLMEVVEKSRKVCQLLFVVFAACIVCTVCPRNNF